MLGFHERIQRVLPGPRADTGITPRQIRFGELEVDGGLLYGLILGEEDLLRGIAVLRLQTGAFASHAIDAVECRAAFAAVDQTETIFHRLSRAAYLRRNPSCYGATDVLACVGTIWRP